MGMKKRLPKKVRKAIEFALRRARCETCGVDSEAQEAMRIYLDSWVVAPLEHVLRWDDGDDDVYLDWGR